jgi:hypothetical protein
MWNGLVWFFDKLGWTLKIWNGLVIDLVMVNYIICTPLAKTNGSIIKMKKNYCINVLHDGERFVFLQKLNKITNLFSTQTTVLSPRPSLTTTPQFSHIPPFDPPPFPLYGCLLQLQLPPSLFIIPHHLTLSPCSRSMTDFLYNGPVTPPNRKYFSYWLWIYWIITFKQTITETCDWKTN